MLKYPIMDTNIEQNTENQEDEISLLDLFAVLIRYRKLVVLGTLITAVLAALYLYALPAFSKNKAKEQTVSATFSVDVKPIPASIAATLADYDKVNPLYLATYNINRLAFLVEQIKKHNIFSSSGIQGYEFNNYIQSLLDHKVITIDKSELGNEFDITFTIPLSKVDAAAELVKSIVSETDKSVQEYYTNLRINLEDADGNFDGFLTLHDEPLVILKGNGSGRTKKFIIILFAAFFVFVFIAFCRNAVVNIKADPDARKLISDAWKAGK